MRLVVLLCAMVLTGCDPMEPSGNVLAPVAATPTAAPAPAPTAAPAPAPAEAFDFDADAPEPDAEGDTGEPDADTIAAGLGLEPTPVEPSEPAVADVEPDLPPEPAPEPAWRPGDPMVGSWGVRLVSTVAQSQPPRAILGMPDGTEAVVQPGTLLPDHGLVVMAVGQDAIEVAEIVPIGDHVEVKTRVLQAMYRAETRPR